MFLPNELNIFAITVVVALLAEAAAGVVGLAAADYGYTHKKNNTRKCADTRIRTEEGRAQRVSNSSQWTGLCDTRLGRSARSVF